MNQQVAFSSGKIDYRTLLRDAALELRRMRAELEESKLKHRAPIAIIGMGCRFPGGANDLAAYWALLRDGVDAIRDMLETSPGRVLAVVLGAS